MGNKRKNKKMWDEWADYERLEEARGRLWSGRDVQGLKIRKIRENTPLEAAAKKYYLRLVKILQKSRVDEHSEARYKSGVYFPKAGHEKEYFSLLEHERRYAKKAEKLSEYETYK